MIELIRNCSHGSEISTYLAAGGAGEKRIFKTASTPCGIENLNREIEGWGWYQEAIGSSAGHPLCRIAAQGKGYLKIEIKFIEGRKADYRCGLEKNVDIIRKAVSHYCETWPRSSSAGFPLHGDLSIDNIIVNAGKVTIIDWEHFSRDGAPWAYDALHLLFETLWFGMRRRGGRITPQEVDIIAENIDRLNADNRSDPGLTKFPLRFTRGFIDGNAERWGNQISVFPCKFPVCDFTAAEISEIDGKVSEALKRI
ncbi:MAG: phosphotransferase [Candidatus Omnitrophota bacterium]|jgi:hypothetical protein